MCSGVTSSPGRTSEGDDIMRFRSAIILITILSLLSCGVITFADAKGANTPGNDSSTLTKGNNEFAIDLYRSLSKAGGNLFFSPCSISVALAMTSMGARGNTAAEMAKTLHFYLKGVALHQSFGALVAKMNEAGARGNYKLSIANRLWGQKNHKFLEPFIAGLKKYYAAPLELVDFTKETEKTRVTINKWVEKMTQEKIKDLLKPGVLTSDSVLVLTNAIYFKGDWESKFKKEMTKKEPFFITPEKKVDVDMMHKTEDLRYGKAGDVAILEIPYKSKDLSMVILLPEKRDGIKKLDNSLTAAVLEKMRSTMAERKVNVSFPRFKATSEFKLNEVLQKMGMKDAFTPSMADFSGMTGTKELFISAVVHKAFVAVDEEGTEAAAATAVVMSRESAEPMPVEFRADHPFIFMIRDNKSGSILFMGRLMDPQGK
jgi:serpin B